MDKTLKDGSSMPFGQHKNKIMADVPTGWLLWLWGENVFQYKNMPSKMDETTRLVMNYINESFENLPE